MNIIPAIDLIGGKAVRLQKGDYAKITVYSDTPEEVAKSFRASGARFLHVVDLDGAKSGKADNFETVKKIVEATDLSVEIGGGIRSMEIVDLYASIGVDRIILGTAALTDPEFLKAAVARYGERIAVGVDINDGMVAIKGWTEVSDISCDDFCRQLESLGVGSVICTDISKDGMMSGTNLELYSKLCQDFNIRIVASGGISTLEDIRALIKMDIYGAILGKALYTGAIDLSEAVKLTGETV
ncbi:MAG: 1-(5-phosphoribosyl)-5-[(5-phosphoribosylamino)methylideneamino]imidazole-4-carboxamide isomerase [Clostridia bacterium]|nr:1-(5-phosphoribosyl)-5-[(5-phosphoribosylamino)methylideneamino]imidazole-4-carboxamide isomerase [Clostridia bacterium]